ncbi:hypothetical protein B0H16DRAFT_1299350, partial [Mycena metata]
KFIIDTGAGVIDADYRGSFFCPVLQADANHLAVEEGDHVPQLIVERIYTPDVLEVQVLTKVDPIH